MVSVMVSKDTSRDLPTERRGWSAPEAENFETPMEVTFYSGRA